MRPSSLIILFGLAAAPLGWAAFPLPCPDSATVSLPSDAFPFSFTASTGQALYTAAGGSIYSYETGAPDNAYKTSCIRAVSAIQSLTNPDTGETVTFQVITTNPFSPPRPGIANTCFVIYRANTAPNAVQAVVPGGEMCSFSSSSPPPALNSEGMPTITKTAGGAPPQCSIPNSGVLPLWLRGRAYDGVDSTRNWTLSDNYATTTSLTAFTNPNTGQPVSIYDISSRCFTSITPLAGVDNGYCVSGWSDLVSGIAYQALIRSEPSTVLRLQWLDSNAAGTSCPPDQFAEGAITLAYAYASPLPPPAPQVSATSTVTPPPAGLSAPPTPSNSASALPVPVVPFPATCNGGATLPAFLSAQLLTTGYERYLTSENRVLYETFFAFETYCVTAVSSLVAVNPPAGSGVQPYSAYIATVNNKPDYPGSTSSCFVFVWPSSQPNANLKPLSVFRPDSPLYCTAAGLSNYTQPPPDPMTVFDYFPPTSCQSTYPSAGTVPPWLQGELVMTPPGVSPALSAENHSISDTAFFMTRALPNGGTSGSGVAIERLSECIESVSPFFGLGLPNQFGVLLKMRLILASNAAPTTSGGSQCILLVRRQASGSQVSAFWYTSAMLASSCPDGSYSSDPGLTRADWYFTNPVPPAAPSSAPSDSASSSATPTSSPSPVSATASNSGTAPPSPSTSSGSSPSSTLPPSFSASTTGVPPSPSIIPPSPSPPAPLASPSSSLPPASPSMLPPSSPSSLASTTATPIPTASGSPSRGASPSATPSSLPSSLPALKGILLSFPVTFPGVTFELALANAASIQLSLAVDLSVLWSGLGVAASDVAVNWTSSSSSLSSSSNDAPASAPEARRRALLRVGGAATLATLTLFPFQPGDNPMNPSTSRAQASAMTAQSYLQGNLTAAGGSAGSLFPRTMQTIQSITGGAMPSGVIVGPSSAAPYAPPPPPAATASAMPSTDPSGGKAGSLPGGGVAGIIVAALVIGGLVLGFLLYRRSKTRASAPRMVRASSVAGSGGNNAVPSTSAAGRKGASTTTTVVSNPVLGHSRTSINRNNNDDGGLPLNTVTVGGQSEAHRNSYGPTATAAGGTSARALNPMERAGQNGQSARAIRASAMLAGGPPVSPVSSGPTQNLLSPRSKAAAREQ